MTRSGGVDCGPLCRDSQDIPLNGLVELLQVDAELHNVIHVLVLPRTLVPRLLVLLAANIRVLVT